MRLKEDNFKLVKNAENLENQLELSQSKFKEMEHLQKECEELKTNIKEEREQLQKKIETLTNQLKHN